MPNSSAAIQPTPAMRPDAEAGMTYGRSRLLLGVSGVGTWVVLAAGVLIAGLPAWLESLTAGTLAGDALAVLCIALIVVLIQAPFDLFGGYVLPRRHARSAEPFGRFARRWLRGVAAYQSLYLCAGLLLLLASRGVGAAGMVLVGVVASVLMLAIRTPLARLIGGVRRTDSALETTENAVTIASEDPGFTGGVSGVLRARRQLVPELWTSLLGPELLSMSLRRRREAVMSGLWLRGRIGALLFVWIGLALSATQVGPLVGTAGGVLAFGAFFTLWSFVGLLVLPTPSRRASMAVDERLRAQGVEPADLERLAEALDRMQDGEPKRPGWIETIFHPIPNVASRNDAERSSRLAAWDVARTSAYLGMTGLSPLGRAVHCNSGRPPLWVYLPLD